MRKLKLKDWLKNRLNLLMTPIGACVGVSGFFIGILLVKFIEILGNH